MNVHKSKTITHPKYYIISLSSTSSFCCFVNVKSVIITYAGSKSDYEIKERVMSEVSLLSLWTLTHSF